jgi:hypothetical protein
MNCSEVPQRMSAFLWALAAQVGSGPAVITTRRAIPAG